MNVLSDKWCKRFLSLSHQIASWSKDDSSKVGCVIIDAFGKPKSYGFNGFPRGIDDSKPERHERPEKYLWFEHAERNAIYQSPIDLTGCIAFVTHAPCSGCARAIIQSGINFVIVDEANGYNSKFAERMGDEARVAKEMFDEVKMKLKELKIEN